MPVTLLLYTVPDRELDESIAKETISGVPGRHHQPQDENVFHTADAQEPQHPISDKLHLQEPGVLFARLQRQVPAVGAGISGL